MEWTKWERVFLCSWPKVKTLETLRLSKNLLLRCVLAMFNGCVYLLFPDIKSVQAVLNLTFSTECT